LAIYNTPSDAANTAVRSFLTKVGEYYLGKGFNTGSGFGKHTWAQIKTEYFDSRCAYCEEEHEKLQIEHVIMFNRTEFGLHHPGNIVPCCKPCNKRERLADKTYCNWEQHLQKVCESRGELHKLQLRKDRITNNFQRFNYPVLTKEEQHAIGVIANSLYENIKTESDKSLNLYKELDKAFVQK
jgi:hypothetical protein